MSKIAVSSPASGTATYTISAPAGSTDRTISLPDATGTILTTATPGVPVNGPAFSAYANASTSVANTTFTKLLFQVEEFDTNSNFSSSRFTPTVAGYYQINGMVSITSSPASGILLFSLFKNGVRFLDANQIPFASQAPKCLISCLVYLNGSTDYVELYGYQSSGGTVNLLSNGLTEGYFQAFLARSAT
jgi:hypothetical protein